ncbi:hypothetical protein H4S02_003736 [Coemansia sp. RSA 2611]|nr:hypothetical protein H4S02_003736 [Coemansia sp. RSA 2611]
MMPTALEYSHNDSSSIEYAFGLQILPTLLEFVNSITLLYRGVQALKEGIEHVATSGHHSHSSSTEFETYAHTSHGHNQDAVLGLLSVALAMFVTVYSAARFANHHSLWEACSQRRQDIGSRLQNVLLNPYNAASLFADCSRRHVWSRAHDKHSIALRVLASPTACDGKALQRHIAGILGSSGLSDWTVEIRAS